MANQNNNTDLLFKHSFFLLFIFLVIWLFLLDYNKIHKKQKFSAHDIVESWSKDMWSILISCVACVDIIAQISLTPWSVVLFLYVSTLKLNIFCYYFTDRPTCNNSRDCLYNKKLSCLYLTRTNYLQRFWKYVVRFCLSVIVIYWKYMSI